MGIAKTAAEYGGLVALTTFNTALHESTHCATAIVTGSSCKGIELSNSLWYSGIFETLSLGFFKSNSAGGWGGVTSIVHSTSWPGRLSGFVSTAAPEYLNAAVGLTLVSYGLQNVGKRLPFGMLQAYTGVAMLGYSFHYMESSVKSANGGHDYTNATKQALGLVGIPESIQDVVSPVVTPIGVAGFFAAAMYTAAFVTMPHIRENLKFWNKKEKK